MRRRRRLCGGWGVLVLLVLGTGCEVGEVSCSCSGAGLGSLPGGRERDERGGRVWCGGRDGRGVSGADLRWHISRLVRAGRRGGRGGF